MCCDVDVNRIVFLARLGIKIAHFADSNEKNYTEKMWEKLWVIENRCMVEPGKRCR